MGVEPASGAKRAGGDTPQPHHRPEQNQEMSPVDRERGSPATDILWLIVGIQQPCPRYFRGSWMRQSVANGKDVAYRSDEGGGNGNEKCAACDKGRDGIRG
jgi:hypothetical protein